MFDVSDHGVEPIGTDAGTSSLPPPGYPAELVSGVITGAGASLHLRPIRPDDGPRLVRFHQQLSPRTVYRRFFFVHPKLSAAEVERFTCVDYVDRLALVVEDGGQLVAVGRYERRPGTDEAEVAFVVADHYQHHGIGTLLLEHLADAAWRCGITTFVASTLAGNHDMLSVFADSGFPVSTSVEDGVVEVRFPIEPGQASRAVRAAHHARVSPPAGDRDGVPPC